MAELADALRSGRSESNLMRVQVPPSAHNGLRKRLAERRVFLFASPHIYHQEREDRERKKIKESWRSLRASR